MIRLISLSAVTLMLIMNQNAFAHGLIEKIECHTNDGRELFFYGHEVEEPSQKSAGEYELYFFLYSPDLGLQDLNIAQFGLEDIIRDDQVIEKITINFQERGQVELRIPEVYELKTRPGVGDFRLDGPKVRGELDCRVTYE